MEIVNLRILLMGTKPQIFRDVRVAVDMNLDDFQFVIRIVMPWDDWHLHAFEAGGYTWGFNEVTELDLETYTHTLRNMLDAAKAVNGRITYLYDFGDKWKHLIKVGAYGQAEPGVDYPMLVAAKGACPPEDIGGVEGYYHALQVIKDPKHPDFEIYDGFFPENYDPDHVDLEALRHTLHKTTRKMKLGAKTWEGEYIPPKQETPENEGQGY